MLIHENREPCRGMQQGELPPECCIDRYWCGMEHKCLDQTIREAEQRLMEARRAKEMKTAERALFEAEMRKKHPEWAFTTDPVFDYHNERTRYAWEGWRAARAHGVTDTVDRAERLIEALIEKLRRCPRDCLRLGQCKAAMHGLPIKCAAPLEPVHGFSRDDLECIAEGLEKGYERTVNVGSTTGEGDEHLESSTAAAARFIRAALGVNACEAPITSVAEFFAQAERTGFTAADLAEGLRARGVVLCDAMPDKLETPSTDASETVSAIYRALSRGNNLQAQSLAAHYLHAKHAAAGVEGKS